MFSKDHLLLLFLGMTWGHLLLLLLFIVYVMGRWHRVLCFSMSIARVYWPWIGGLLFNCLHNTLICLLLLYEEVVKLFLKEDVQEVELILRWIIYVSVTYLWYDLKGLEKILESEDSWYDLTHRSATSYVWMCWQSTRTIGWIPILRWLEYYLLQEVKLDYNLKSNHIVWKHTG